LAGRAKPVATKDLTAVLPAEPPNPTFNVRSIGPEPSGATPLKQEDRECLIPDFVATLADLNQVEFESIAKTIPLAQKQARTLEPEGLLDYGFMLQLHRQMFGDVWTWAGKQRRRATNIGVEVHLITTQSQLLTWGGANLGVDGSGRATYMAALIKAVDTGDHADLVRFARGRRVS
jgi:hypothetical protein